MFWKAIREEDWGGTFQRFSIVLLCTGVQGELDKHEDRSGAELGILQQNSFLLMESVAMVTQCACVF